VHVLGGRERGGIATQLVTLAGQIDPNLISLSAILLTRTDLAERLAEAGFHTQLVPKRGRGDLLVTSHLARALRIAAPDIVHTHSVTSNLYGRVAARLARAPVVVTTVHGFVPDILRRHQAVPWWLTKPTHLLDLKMSCLADRLIAVSDAIARDLEHRGVNPEKIVTIPNGVDVCRFQAAGDARSATRQALRISSSAPVVGTVGSLVPLRNHALLLSAAAQAVAAVRDLKFLLVGDGPERARLESLARQLGISDQVIFAGHRPDVPQLLSAMDIFVLSCDTEGFGIAALEAMAAGLPLVATRVGALVEVVGDGQAGLLVPPGNSSALARALLDLLRNPSLARHLGEQGKARAEAKYSAARMAERLTQLYLELGGRVAGSRPQSTCQSC